MSTDENKAIVRRFYEEIDRGNIDAIDELVDPEYFNHASLPFPVSPGRAGLKEAFRLFWAATPGRHEIEDMVAEGDRVVTRLTAYGTHDGDLPGIPAAGTSLTMTAIAIHRVVDGKIVEHWSAKDELGFSQHLGVIPVAEHASG